MDKENTPPPERRGVRALTPSQDNERSLPAAPDVNNPCKLKIFIDN